MSEFLKLVPPGEALDHFLGTLADQAYPRRVESISTGEAWGRTLADSIRSPESLPPFTRSTVDGFAVRAADTFGASSSLPAYLQLVGEVRMGEVPDLALGKGESAVIHTGGMLPSGADAVVMIEDTHQAADGELEVLKAVAAAENVLPAGEDLTEGDVAFEAGRRLRPQDIGGLMALGQTQVTVAGKPTVGILSCGDEIAAPDAAIAPGQVRDVNSAMLAALVARAGGAPVHYGIVPDDLPRLERAAAQAHDECDVVVVTAGSSVSARDRTAEVLGGLGSPGVLVHGVSIKPGKPTILAVCDGTPALGLPGNPVSALIVATLFLVPLIHRMLGQDPFDLVPTVAAEMAANVASQAGREDYLPVRLVPTGQTWTAEPVYGRSNLIFTLVRADGLVRIPPEANGLPSGATVHVRLFD